MMGPTDIVIAIAVILSAVVSLIGTSARKQAVADGRATIADLCELSGVLEPRILQDLFGPPTLDGVYHISLADIRRRRTKLALLISEDWLDLACILVAVASFFISHPLADLFLMMAGAYQIAGWVISMRLPQNNPR